MQDSLKNWPALGYFQRTDREMLFRERGVKQFIESGAVMGMGTDSGTPMNFHSEALWREIKVHVDMGMTPQRAIAAATRVNAQIIGKGRELGTIEPGKLADIIVVKGNPLFDIMALSNVEIGREGRNGLQGRRRLPNREPGRRPAAANSVRASCPRIAAGGGRRPASSRPRRSRTWRTRRTPTPESTRSPIAAPAATTPARTARRTATR